MTYIPDWLKKEENYKAERSNSAFVDRTILEMVSKITRFQKVNHKSVVRNSLIDLLVIIETILLMSLSTNMLFTYIILALLLVGLCMMDGEEMTHIIHGGIIASVICMLILLPSLLLGNTKTFIRITLKVFLSSSMIYWFNEEHSANEIISCLKSLHIPDVIIFTLDMTFKFIVLLSKTCEEILTALKCRIIGKLKKNDRSLMNVGGMTFIRSLKYSDDMNDAMKCRGFNGTYYNHMHFKMNKIDYISVGIMIVEVVCFVVLGR